MYVVELCITKTSNPHLFDSDLDYNFNAKTIAKMRQRIASYRICSTERRYTSFYLYEVLTKCSSVSHRPQRVIETKGTTTKFLAQAAV